MTLDLEHTHKAVKGESSTYAWVGGGGSPLSAGAEAKGSLPVVQMSLQLQTRWKCCIFAQGFLHLVFACVVYLETLVSVPFEQLPPSAACVL